jgi:hypothetical protein
MSLTDLSVMQGACHGWSDDHQTTIPAAARVRASSGGDVRPDSREYFPHAVTHAVRLHRQEIGLETG